MASVVYDNKAIIPAPLVNINKNYLFDGAGNKHGVLYEITLAGTLLPFRGSPSGNYPLGDPSNAFWTLGGYPPDETYVGDDTPFARLERKQEALRWLFREDGKILEWYGGAASPVTCRPRIRNITFPEGQWVDRCEYVIELEADYLTGITGEDAFDGSGIQDVSEDWQISESIGHAGQVYEITHTVNAKGVKTFDEVTGNSVDGWINSKDWCEARILGTPDNDFVQYATGFTDWVNGGYTKSSNVSIKDGHYTIIETWIIKAAGYGVTATTYIDKSFNFTSNTENESIEVTYNGVIYGLQDGERTGGSAAIETAKAAVPTNSQAKTEVETALSSFLDGYEIPETPTQKNIAVNNKDGSVSFSFVWSAGEDKDYLQTNEATINYNASDGIYKLDLIVDIEGKGETKEERLANARLNIPADATAFTLAKSIIGSQKPAGVIFTGDFISKTSVINETRGTARVSWSWSDTAEHSEEISVDIEYPQIITAKLFVPGRIAGPIIQRMNTATAQQITVTYNSSSHTTKPDSDDIADTMDDAGGIPDISPWYPGSYILETDRESWNPTTGRYSRTRVHTVTED